MNVENLQKYREFIVEIRRNGRYKNNILDISRSTSQFLVVINKDKIIEFDRDDRDLIIKINGDYNYFENFVEFENFFLKQIELCEEKEDIIKIVEKQNSKSKELKMENKNLKYNENEINKENGNLKNQNSKISKSLFEEFYFELTKEMLENIIELKKKIIDIEERKNHYNNLEKFEKKFEKHIIKG